MPKAANHLGKISAQYDPSKFIQSKTKYCGTSET